MRRSLVIACLLSVFIWTNTAYASEKVLKSANLGVAFELDATGKLLALKAHSPENRALEQKLFERFKDEDFLPRTKDGMSASATVQAIVPMRAILNKDGHTVEFIFDAPVQQPVWLSGTKIDKRILDKNMRMLGLAFDVMIKIKADGTVMESIIKPHGIRKSEKAESIIREAVSSWRFAVDVVDGVPIEMDTNRIITIGKRSDCCTRQMDRPGTNNW